MTQDMHTVASNCCLPGNGFHDDLETPLHLGMSCCGAAVRFFLFTRFASLHLAAVRYLTWRYMLRGARAPTSNVPMVAIADA